MHTVVFEDPLVRQLEPVTLGRAAYSIECGSTTLADWLAEQDATIQGLVRPYLHDWQVAEYPRFAASPVEESTQLLVNARLVPCQTTFNTLRKLSGSAQPGLVFQGETLAAALLPPGSPALRRADEVEHLTAFLRHPQIASLPILEHRLPLLNFPHELVSRHVESIGDNLQRRIASGRYREVRDGVFLATHAQLAEWAHTDTTQGPIVLEPGCVVKPFACLRGPLHLGAMSHVNEHSLLKPAVSVGKMCKVGGEIEASVIEPFTNKQHTGYLGHSYLGRWVNLGAGTSNSNLKNTYGTVRMEVLGRQIDTGMQLMGCVIGDFTKSAINTGIFTGKLIGGCSMVYGFVTTNVESFVNYARSFGEVTDLSPEVMAQTQKRAFLRRGIEQQAWQVRLLREMYEIASNGRQLADRPVSL